MTFGFGFVGIGALMQQVEALQKRLEEASYNKKHPIETMEEKPKTKEEQALAKTLFEDYESTNT